MIIRSIAFLSVLLSLSAPSLCQTKEIQQKEMAWFAYFNQTRLTNKSGLWADIHLRMDDFMNEVNMTILRAGYTYYFSDKARLTAGYGFITQPAQEGSVKVTEHRPWQQLQWFEKKSWFSMSQYLRTEQRYRKAGDSDYNFLSHRIRYNISITFPLRGREIVPGTPFIFLSDELMINAGKNIVNNYFDQNRFFLGIGYQFTAKLNAHIGYLNVFQQLAAPNRYVESDALRLFIFHNLDFRHKAE